jgi:hypothetical protein
MVGDFTVEVPMQKGEAETRWRAQQPS